MDIIKLAHSLNLFVVGCEGNVSSKTNNGFLIKASGKSLSNLLMCDLVACDFGGNKIDESNLKPSIETGFHSFLLKNENINYVAHTHPINTLKILCSEYIYEFGKKRMFPDQVVFNGVESCVVEYFHPGRDLLINIETSFNNFTSKFGRIPKLILLKNHGIICMGKNIDECIIATEICEKSAEIFIGSINNSPTYLSIDDIHKIENDQNEKYRQK